MNSNLGLEPDNRFRLTTSAKIYALAITLLLFARAARFGLNSFETGECLGGALAAMILSLAAAWMTWLARSKKDGAGSLVFGVLFTFALFNKMGADAGRKSLSQSAREIEQSTRDFQKESADATNLQEVERAAGKYTVSIKASLDAMARGGDGSDREAVAMIAEHISGMQADSLRWYRACDAANTPGMLSWQLLINDAEYDKRTAVLHAYAEESTKALSSLSLGMEPLKVRLGSLADRRSVKPFLKGLETSSAAERPMLEALLQAHLNNAAAMLKLLDFLRTHKTQWVMKGNQLIFSEDPLVAEYMALVKSTENCRTVIEKLSLLANTGNK